VQTLHKSDVKIPTVRITGDGALYLNNKAVNINLLANEIKRSFPKALEVRVRPDKDTPWDVVSQVFAALKCGQASDSRKTREIRRPEKFRVAHYPE